MAEIDTNKERMRRSIGQSETLLLAFCRACSRGATRQNYWGPRRDAASAAWTL